MDDDDLIEHVPPPAVPSPCVAVCRLDRSTGWCIGCGRTGGEIAEWPRAAPDRQRTIIAALHARLNTLKA
ncbi:hypothetical protein FHR23_002985 [Stakelama sediminis]|uniref:DUF1289 domain-containing protein n=1 Tax=Stakelama sediminis TaxID=463200 RepID=A0A840Z281_9SPHN|nr:DUF1289 domain-containing protein [Stakelama sediminis]MBB5720025.1 hypothetical protein [Stakelama sediminis]